MPPSSKKLDVEGILAFAERVLPSASNLWVQPSLNQKQRLQQLFFPEGVRFDGKKLVGTGLTLPVFNYLDPAEDSKVRMVAQILPRWNRLQHWFELTEAFRIAA